VSLTITGTNLKGNRDSGTTVYVINVDNMNTFDGHATLHHGTAKLGVTPGHYWAFACFTDPGPTPGSIRSVHMVVLPQFTVRHATTVAVNERSASSLISFATPRPAATEMAGFTVVRDDAHGASFTSTDNNVGIPLWISPTTTRPTVGTLRTYTQGQATSPARATGVPYAYNLDFTGPPGIIPAQRWPVPPASLATVTERYYQDVRSTGDWGVFGRQAQLSIQFLVAALYPLHLPGRQVQYFTGGPSIAWSSSYDAFEPPAAGQGDGQWSGPNGAGFLTLPAGRHLTVSWGAYPLHPQPDVQPLRGSLGKLSAQFPSAFRTGNTLTLYLTAFSDNTPDHLGTPSGLGLPRHTKVTGTYAIYQNGTEVAHGRPIDNAGAPNAVPTAKLSSHSSAIRFVLATGRVGPHFPLSPVSRTVWTWRSAPGHEATLPRPWFCFGPSGRTQQRCAVQPMMTLDYHVQGLALDGRAPAGTQVIGLDVGHVQPGAQLRVTGASASASFDGGHTWHPATVTGQGGGRFRITFAAPAGADVTLRVHATDVAGGSVTETITSAYGVAS
jgi:hypothetical protein